jgi:hypothetical protein
VSIQDDGTIATHELSKSLQQQDAEKQKNRQHYPAKAQTATFDPQFHLLIPQAISPRHEPEKAE